MKQNHIYLLQDPSNPQWFKCGETTNPDARLKTFQTGYAKTISWYGCWPATNGTRDSELHPIISKMCSDRRSEWFKGDISRVAALVQQIIGYTPEKPKQTRRFSPEPPPLNDFCDRLAERFNYAH
jgi:hypothetical protein